MSRYHDRYVRRPRRAASANERQPRPEFQPLEPRKLLSASPELIGAALDLDEDILVSYLGHDDAVGVYENYSVHGLLGMPSGPDGDFLVLSTAHARDGARITDDAGKDITTRYRDLGDEGVADDFATVSFTLNVTPTTFNQRLLIDFVYASDEDTDGGDYFDIIVNGVNIADANGDRIEAGGQYVTNERDPDVDEHDPAYALEIGTEYSDLLTASYTVPGGVSSLDITIRIADSNDPELDAWALVDNVRFETTQVVYLDFDGQAIGDFFLAGTSYTIDEFDANDFGLGSDFADVIQADLEAMFAGLDIEFVTSLPSQGDYMHVVVGGENRDAVAIEDSPENEWLMRELGDTPRFDELYNFVNFRNANGDEASYGLADFLDLGNESHSDMAVVFAEQISADGYSYSHLRDTIAHYIGRNLGLRAESNAFTDSIMAESIEFRGSMFENSANSFANDDWGDLDALGVTQNAWAVLADNLGLAAGDTHIRNAWTDAAALNEAHWTIAQPTRNPLYNAHFTIIGDRHTRTRTTVADEWRSNQTLITDYAGQDPQIVITASGTRNGDHDFETIGPKNLGQFSAVEDDATFTQIGLWEVVGQGAFFQGSAVLYQTEAADTEVHYTDFQFTDVDGDVIKVSLNSFTGLFTVSGEGEDAVITLAETTGQRDSLKITVSKKSGGDGRATIAGLQGTGLKKLTATDVDFSGTGVDLESVENAQFASILDGTDVNIRQEEGTSAKINFTTISEDSHLVFGRETKKFQADAVSASVMVFEELSKLDSKGNVAVDRFSVYDGQGAKITVKGNIDGGFWEIWRTLKDNGKDVKESLSKLTVNGGVGGGFELSTAGRVGKTTVKQSFSGRVEVAAVQKFQVNGNWSGEMWLTDDGSLFNSAAKKIQAKGIAQNLLFKSLLDVSQIALGAAHSSSFYVGFEDAVVDGLPVDISLLENEDAKIKKLKLTGVKTEAWEMRDTVFSAGRFDKIDLGNVDGENGGDPFGVSATRIKKISFDTGTGKINQKKDNAFTDNDSSDDFFIGQIT